MTTAPCSHACVAALAFASTAIAAPPYAITDLGRSVVDDFGARPVVINNQGHVAAVDENKNAFVWTAGVRQYLPPIQSNGRTFAGDINSFGVVCGGAVKNLETHATYWQNGGVNDLGPFGTTGAEAHGINDFGKIALDTSQNHGYLYDMAAGTSIDIGSLGQPFTRVQGINNAGQIVGYSDDSLSRRRAFVWQNGVMTSLGALGGDSFAYDINDAGVIVGASFAASGNVRAFIHKNNTLTQLATLDASWTSVRAYGVNLGEEIVGRCSKPGVDKALLWRNGAVIDLSTQIPAGSGWTLVGATENNDLGQIVGWGHLQGEVHAFLLTPIPTPSTVLVPLLYIARRRRR